jgi:hypothetical protein
MGWFGKKETVQSLAEVLEDGRAAMDDKMGKEPTIDIAVRVMPEFEVPWEATMKAGIGSSFLLMPGVQVQVKYEAEKKEHVELDDNPQAILARNPQMVRKE